MLPSELLVHRYSGETVVPKQLAIAAEEIALASEYISCFQQAQGETLGTLEQHLQVLEGDAPNYRIKRGLAHLLKNSFSTFEIVSPLEPQQLRQRTFVEAARCAPAKRRQPVLEQVAIELSRELNREVLTDDIQRGLYADLQENRRLTQFEPPTPEALLHRYNLSQVQGVFYRASQIVLNAHRNVPGQYKLLFRYLKLFQLMAYIEGDADHGFTIVLDGPTSLFKASTRYGLALAKMLPALLHVSRWSLKATLEYRDPYSGTRKKGYYSLSSDRCQLVSHYPPGKTYDSLLEESFAKRWEKLKTEWQLEREVDLVPIPGSVMIPDFRLVHPDGRTYLLEIVGYWRPEYLKRKFSQVRRAQADNLILAISERLNLDKAKVNFESVPARLVWFKDKLAPKAILDVLD